MLDLRQSMNRIAIGTTAMIGMLYGFNNRSRIGLAILLFLLLAIVLIVGVSAWRSSQAEPQNHPVVQFQGVENFMTSPSEGRLNVEARPLQSEVSASNISVYSDQASGSGVQVEVNGEQIVVPENGDRNIHQESVSGNNKTTVDISIQADGVSSGVSSNSSSLHLNIDSKQSNVNNSE